MNNMPVIGKVICLTDYLTYPAGLRFVHLNKTVYPRGQRSKNATKRQKIGKHSVALPLQ